MSEEAPRIPLEEHIPPEEHIQIEVNQKPPNDQIDESQREQDPARAEAMAYGGDHHRTKASEHRDVARRLEYEGHGAFKFDDEWSSRHEDKLAERHEEWAGILHDHPISEAYKDRFPNVDLAIEALVQLEDELKSDDKFIEDAENDLKETNIVHVFHGEGIGSLIPICVLITEVSPKLGKEYSESVLSRWASIVDSPSATVGEITDFYKELVQKLQIQPKLNRTNIHRVILDDIRSGRASEQPSHDS